MIRYPNTKQSGLLFVELIIVTAISVIIFGALFVSFQFTVELIASTRAKLSALSLANDRMEFFRSLPYDDVGVVAGFPSGTVPQTSVLTLNGIEFSERVRIDYVDDPADDTAGVDDNGIITDYKQIKLEYTWNVDGNSRNLSLTSYIVPRSIESNVGGGTVRINVLDDQSLPLQGASVRLFTSSTTFSYDVTNPTNAVGSALFAVPADSGYQVEVSANIAGAQYSTSSTYVASAGNPNPAVSPFAVLEADVSTLTFQIGELSDLAIGTKSSVTEDSQIETFDDLSGVASSTGSTTVTSGDLVLLDTFGTYETSGDLFLTPVTPPVLENWEVIRLVADTPINTNYIVRMYTGSAATAYTLIPDADLPGNSSGFTDNLVDISELDPVTYPSIVLGLSLTTTDTAVTPAIEEIETYWRESSVDRSSFTFDVRGDKTIGTELDATPIYKATSTQTTDASGEVTITDLEFDTYRIIPSGGQDVASACPAYPISHQAGIDSDVEILYVPGATDTLRVIVVDSLARPIPGASVQLERSGYDVTQQTNSCGQTFFTGGLTDNSDYEITVGAAGFASQTIDPFTVSGDTVNTITLNP